MENSWLWIRIVWLNNHCFFWDAVWQDHEFLITTLTFEFKLNSCLYQLWTVDVVQYIGSVLSFELINACFLIKMSLILLVVSGLVGIYVTNSTRVEERVMYSDFVFPSICFFFHSEAQFRRRASAVPNLNVIWFDCSTAGKQLWFRRRARVEPN